MDSEVTAKGIGIVLDDVIQLWHKLLEALPPNDLNQPRPTLGIWVTQPLLDALHNLGNVGEFGKQVYGLVTPTLSRTDRLVESVEDSIARQFASLGCYFVRDYFLFVLAQTTRRHETVQ
jgi:hypothetical protein